MPRYPRNEALSSDFDHDSPDRGGPLFGRALQRADINEPDPRAPWGLNAYKAFI